MRKESVKNHGKSIRSKLLNVRPKRRHILSDYPHTLLSGKIDLQNISDPVSSELLPERWSSNVATKKLFRTSFRKYSSTSLG